MDYKVKIVESFKNIGKCRKSLFNELYLVISNTNDYKQWRQSGLKRGVALTK